MSTYLTEIGNSSILTGIAVIITLLLAIAPIWNFVKRSISFLSEGHDRIFDRLKVYRKRLDQTATFAASDDAYLSALFWLKASRTVSISLIIGLCLIIHNMVKDGVLRIITTRPAVDGILGNALSLLSALLAFIALVTLYETYRIARTAVDGKDRMYFPERYG